MYSVCLSCTQEGTRSGDGRKTILSLATDVPADSDELKPHGAALWLVPSARAMVCIDRREFMEKHSVARLIQCLAAIRRS